MSATTVNEYLAELPEDRREIVAALREAMRGAIDPTIGEGIQYGMIGWFVPHGVYPFGYHCDPKQPLPFAGLANQKGHVGLYLFCTYCDQAERERFATEWKKAGKTLDMGKGCVRIKSLDDVPMSVLTRALKRMTAKKFIAAYEAGLPASVKAKRAKVPAPRAGSATAPMAKKTTKKPASKKVTKKKA